MACLNFQNTYFKEHLLMAAFIRFRGTCFSEHLKMAADFLIMFSWLLFTLPLSKNVSLLMKLKDFDFFKATHFTYKRFILAYIWITKLFKKIYFEKFIEEFDSVELSTQAKHLRVWILHGDWLNDSPRNIVSFYIFSLQKFGAWSLWGKVKSLIQHFAGGLTQGLPLKFMLVFFFYETFKWLW